MKRIGKMPHTAGHREKTGDIRYIRRLYGINMHALIVTIQENITKSTIFYNVFTIKMTCFYLLWVTLRECGTLILV